MKSFPRAGANWLIVFRVTLPVLLTVIIFVISIFGVSLPAQRRHLIDSRKRMVYEMTHMAWTLLEHYHLRVSQGELPLETAQRRVAERIRSLRYGSEEKDYFWINDTLPRMVMHPYRTDLENTDITHFRDPSGKALFVDFVKATRVQDHAFVAYLWQWKDDSTTIVPKISNVRIFRPWGWIVGTGMYVQDVDEKINALTRRAMWIFAMMVVFVLTLSGYIIWKSWLAEDRRRQAERALRYSENRYREFLEHANSLIMRWEFSGRITYANPYAESFFGYAPQQLLGMNAFDVLFFDEKEAELLWQQTRVDDWEQGQVCKNRRANDDTVWVHWTVQVMRGRAGHPLDYLVVGGDVTQRIRSEAEISKMKTHLQNIINSMPSVLIGVDEHGRVNKWNKQADTLPEFQAANVMGVTISSLLPYFPQMMTWVEQALQSGEPVIESRVNLKRSESEQWFDVTVYPLVSNGTDGAVIRIDDVSVRVQLEARMIQSEKMLSVGGLAAGMAHEINNPLSGILQNAQVIENRLKPEMKRNAEVAGHLGVSLKGMNAYLEERGILEMLQWIRESGLRAARIVENMLNFARKSDIDFQLIHIIDLMERTLELAASDYNVHKNYDFKRIQIHRNYSEPLPRVKVEPGLLQQVLLNIFLNGAQAMAEGHVEDPSFWLRVSQAGEWLIIEITDNGPGMVKALQQRVFEPFYTTKRVGSGTGLGLSVAYFIITEHHRGRLLVESEEGEGTTFQIQLPLV